MLVVRLALVANGLSSLGPAKRNLRPKRGGYRRDGVGELGLYKMNPRAPFELC